MVQILHLIGVLIHAYVNTYMYIYIQKMYMDEMVYGPSFVGLFGPSEAQKCLSAVWRLSSQKVVTFMNIWHTYIQIQPYLYI